MTASHNQESAVVIDELDVPAGVRTVKSAARTLDILEFLSVRQNRPVRLREISEELDLPRSSVYALLRTLTVRGWVDTDASGTLYSIGIRALLTGTTYLDSDPYLRLVQPHLDSLNEILDETIHFGRLDGNDIVYLATRDSSQYLRMHSRVGRRLPAHATGLGKSLLAELDRDIPDELTALTPHTITDPQKFQEELRAIQERGYAIDHEENSLGIRCYGFALHYHSPVRDAISCSIPLVRVTQAVEEKVVTEMKRVVSEIERLVPLRLI